MKSLLTPIPEILSYEITDPKIKKNLKSYSDALNKLVSIGTHLFDWEFSQVEDSETLHTDEILQVSMYFRRILDFVDSISIQIKVGSIDPAFSQLRVLFELCIQFQHLISSDTLRKSRCILLCDMYRKINIVEKSSPSIPLTLIKEDSEISLMVINRHSLADVKAEYESLKADCKAGEIKWYRLFSRNTPDFRKLIEIHHSNYKIFYQYLYKEFGNDVVHSTSLLQGNIKFENETIIISSIRNTTGALDLVSWTFHIIRDTFEKFVQRRTKEQNSLYINALLRIEKDHFDIAFNLKKYLDNRSLRNGDQ